MTPRRETPLLRPPDCSGRVIAVCALACSAVPALETPFAIVTTIRDLTTMKFFGLFLVVLCAGAALANDEASSRKLLYTQEITAGAGTPGYGSMKGKTTTGEYDSDRLEAAAKPGIAMGFTVMSIGLIVAVFNCMGKCGKGGCQAACLQTLCCTGPPNPRGYTKAKRIMMGVWIILCWVILVVCAAVYSSSASTMSEGMDSLIDDALIECNKNTKIAKDTKSALLAEKITMPTDPDIESQKACDAISNGKSTMAEMPTWILGVWVVACVVPLLGVAAWICGKGSLSVGLVVLSWIVMMLLWFAFGAASTQAAWMDDTCIQLQDWCVAR